MISSALEDVASILRHINVSILFYSIEKSLGDQFQEQMGSFQHSMMDAFNKLAATVTVSKHPQDPSSPQGDQTKSHSKPGPSSAPSPPRPWYQQVPSHEPMDTTTAQVGPELPPRLRAQCSDISSDPEMEPPRAKSEKKLKRSRNIKTNLNTSPPVMSAPHLRHPLTVLNPKKLADLPIKQGNISSDRDQEKSKQTASTIVYMDVRELNQERRRSHEVRRELPPDPIYSQEVDLSDLPSHYTEDIETFRQVLGIPDPKHSMPVSNLIMGVNEEQEKQEARPKGPSTFLPANPALKEELTKQEQDFQNLNICISPRPQVAPGVRAFMWPKNLNIKPDKTSALSQFQSAVVLWIAVGTASSPLLKRPNIISLREPILRWPSKMPMRQPETIWISGTRESRSNKGH